MKTVYYFPARKRKKNDKSREILNKKKKNPRIKYKLFISSRFFSRRSNKNDNYYSPSYDLFNYPTHTQNAVVSRRSSSLLLLWKSSLSLDFVFVFLFIRVRERLTDFVWLAANWQWRLLQKQ